MSKLFLLEEHLNQRGGPNSASIPSKLKGERPLKQLTSRTLQTKVSKFLN